MTVDQQIVNIDTNIRKNLSSYGGGGRGLLAQNILSQLRNLIEACMVRIKHGAGTIQFDYSLVKDAKSDAASHGHTKFLYDFHERLQRSESHYTLDEDASERLMLRYLDYLYRTRALMKQECGITILTILENYPINQALQAPYRESIARAVDNARMMTAHSKPGSERYYIWRSTPFFALGHVYYEVTLTPARDRLSNTDHLVAYTSHDILPNHAVRVSLDNPTIEVEGLYIPITVILDWQVSIRPCELAWMARILGNEGYKTSAREQGYRQLMRALFRRMSSMLDVARLAQPYYSALRQELLQSGAKKEAALLDSIRSAIEPSRPGANIVAYLAYGMRNGVLKQQYYRQSNPKLSGLFLQYGSIGFDEMPLCTHPCGHIARLTDVLACVNRKGRDHELLSARLTTNVERDGILFTPIDELPFEDPESLRQEFNQRIYPGHRDTRAIESHNEHFYIKGYVSDAIAVLQKLSDLTSCGISRYSQQVEQALLSTPVSNNDYSEEKLVALKALFSSSRVAAVYGSAGTGKSTFISLVSTTTTGRKLFLAYTHAAVENLERRVGKDSGDFETIEAFIRSRRQKKYSLVVVDECSTVPNAKMREVLDRAQMERLLLVGDECQIGSIRFGNWFEACKRLLPKSSQFILETTFRTSDKTLLDLWKAVRMREGIVDEILAKNGLTSRLGPEVFTRTQEDEIVLCLSYNGLYGVNNINRILQQSNAEDPVEWQHHTYKVGDPVVFGDSKRFLPAIHNNSKGVIRRIEKHDEKAIFEVEVQSFFGNELSADFVHLGNPSKKTTLVRFVVFRGDDSIDDDMSTGQSRTVMPFQIAYAVSIHKAQGLEYDSVKLVIPCEVDDLITHDIFYTAITRARQHLKVYWEPESQAKVLRLFESKTDRARMLNKEIAFLRQIASERGVNL